MTKAPPASPATAKGKTFINAPCLLDQIFLAASLTSRALVLPRCDLAYQIGRKSEGVTRTQTQQRGTRSAERRLRSGDLPIRPIIGARHTIVGFKTESAAQEWIAEVRRTSARAEPDRDS
jgi:hypothetical protein